MTPAQLIFIPGQPRLAADSCGDGPLLVFMHGIGGNRSNWQDQLPAFGAHFRAVAWDARGYGASDDYAGPLDFGADLSADLLRTLDHLGARKAILCGLSMGGRIAQAFFDRHPERVAAMVLCDTAADFVTDLSPAQRAEFVRLRKAPLLAGGEPRDIAPVVARTLMGPQATPAHMQRLIDSMSALHKESYLKAIDASYGDSARRLKPLGSIDVPVLLVYGADDTLTPPALGRAMQAAIAGAQFVEIAAAGHLCNIEAPDVFNREVLAFALKHRHLAA